MTNVKFLSGIATNVSMISSTYGSSYKGTGSISTFHRLTFRIDNKPVIFPQALNLSEGDEVKVAGSYIRGEFHARVLKNLTTDVGYINLSKGGGCFIILSLLPIIFMSYFFFSSLVTGYGGPSLNSILIVLLLTIPFIIYGVYWMKMYVRDKDILNSM